MTQPTRDEIALKALSSLIQNSWHEAVRQNENLERTAKDVARLSYQIADSMLEQRKEPYGVYKEKGPAPNELPLSPESLDRLSGSEKVTGMDYYHRVFIADLSSLIHQSRQALVLEKARNECEKQFQDKVQEIGAILERIAKLEAGLKSIDGMLEEENEWDAVEKYHLCRKLAREALDG